MKLSLMNLGVDVTPDMQLAEDIILERCNWNFGDPAAFRHYGSEKDFVAAVSREVETADVIFVTVEPRLFPAFKKYLSSMFDMKIKVNKSLQRQITKVYPHMNEEVLEGQCIMPVSADVILSKSTANSGFALKANHQILIALPLDPEEMPFLLDDGVFPYLRNKMDAAVFASNPLEGVISARNAAKAEQAQAQAPAKPAAPETIPINSAFVQSVVQKLRAENKTVVMANTKTVDFMKNVAAATDLRDTILLSPVYFEKGTLNTELYAVKLAKETYEKSHGSLGACVTKVFAKTMEDGTKQYYIFACISDGATANTARVVADPGDTPPTIIYRAIEVLFRMINSYLDHHTTAMPEDPGVEVVAADEVKNALDAITAAVGSEPEAEKKKPVILA